MLRKAAVNSQVIVSTQSVPLVNQFQPEDVIVVDREGPESTFHRLEEDKLEACLHFNEWVTWLEGV